jgi:hypothetical protein
VKHVLTSQFLVTGPKGAWPKHLSLESDGSYYTLSSKCWYSTNYCEQTTDGHGRTEL